MTVSTRKRTLDTWSANSLAAITRQPAGTPAVRAARGADCALAG
jgi:hypothetical protein